MKKSTIESKVAGTVLQEAECINLGGKIYKVSPPSIGTLIMVSDAVSKLPSIKLDSDKIMSETLYVAKDCDVLGDILAILILGAKRLRAKRWCSIVDRKKRLKKEILENVTPKELHIMTARMLQLMEISDFFGLTTSLIEINLLHKTQEVGTIVSGRS